MCINFEDMRLKIGYTIHSICGISTKYVSIFRTDNSSYFEGRECTFDRLLNVNRKN